MMTSQATRPYFRDLGGSISTPQIREVCPIAVPALRNLERYASLQRFEGLKALIRPPNRAIIEGIVYELILPSKMLRHGINRPLLVLHPTKEFLEKVLHIRDLSAMFVISYDKPN
jgi:hypothetical protein